MIVLIIILSILFTIHSVKYVADKKQFKKQIEARRTHYNIHGRNGINKRKDELKKYV